MTEIIISEHLDFLEKDPVLVDEKICFHPSNLNVFQYEQPLHSNLDHRLLPRHVYLARQQYQEDIRRLHLISQALQYCQPSENITVYLSEKPTLTHFNLPMLLKYQKKPSKYPLVIQTGNHFLFINGYLCLLPGEMKESEGKYLYNSLSLEKALEALNDKKKYDVGSYYVDLTGEENLEQLQDKFINFMRNRVKRQLQEGTSSENVELYRITSDEVFPVEQIITEGYVDKLQQLVKDFPLIYTNFKKEITLYVNQDDAVILSGDKIEKCGDPKRNFLINLMLASSTRSEQHDFPIAVEMRALHINYAYQIIDEPPIYEDYLGSPCWIIAPVELYRSKGIIHGKISYPPHYLLKLFIESTSEQPNN